MDCLRRKHAVKGVFVFRGQTACAECMFEADWQWHIPCKLDGRNEIIDEDLSSGKFAQAIFCCDFPSRDR